MTFYLSQFGKDLLLTEPIRGSFDGQGKHVYADFPGPVINLSGATATVTNFTLHCEGRQAIQTDAATRGCVVSNIEIRDSVYQSLHGGFRRSLTGGMNTYRDLRLFRSGLTYTGGVRNTYQRISFRESPYQTLCLGVNGNLLADVDRNGGNGLVYKDLYFFRCGMNFKPGADQGVFYAGYDLTSDFTMDRVCFRSCNPKCIYLDDGFSFAKIRTAEFYGCGMAYHSAGGINVLQGFKEVDSVLPSVVDTRMDPGGEPAELGKEIWGDEAKSKLWKSHFYLVMGGSHDLNSPEYAAAALIRAHLKARGYFDWWNEDYSQNDPRKFKGGGILSAADV